jgi:hypothetical protein
MMRIRPLIMDEDARSEIKRVRDFAEHHPLTASKAKAIMAGTEPPPGDDPRHACNIQVGYRCVYTLDLSQRKDDARTVVWLRHLSISVHDPNDRGAIPHPAAMNLLMEEFGFRQRIGQPEAVMSTWLENENDPTMPLAVNVVEEFENDS